MSFGDHLEELRRRLFMALIVPIPLKIVLFAVSDWLINILRLPLTKAMLANDLDPTLQALGPAEVLLTQMKLSIIAALILSAPWILWQAWLFIAPGLYTFERRFVRFLIPLSAVLTLAGAVLMYYAMLPLILYVLVGFGARLSQNIEPTGVDAAIAAWVEENHDVAVRPTLPTAPADGDGCLVWPDMTMFVALPDADGAIEWVPVPRAHRASVLQEYRLNDYISFTLMLFLGIVIAFQLPLVILLLHWIGLAERAWFIKHRKHAVLVCAIVSAVITPADVISMIAMLIPLYGLYEFGILLVRFAPARRVAAGEVLARPGRGSDKPPAQPSKSPSATQSGTTAPRSQPLDQWQVEEDDGDDDDREGNNA
ncbi:MAG: twin-arginine translocase subunit TatC [Phycisphaerales bacterium]|nr:twin-arginine translocase subunit TatC [Phycisphaerales bacterium]